MKHWARISRDTADSRRLSETLAQHPFADALFWRLKAWADDFGRFHADPMKVLTKVAGRAAIEFGLPLSAVVEALDVLERLGLIRRYEVAGEQYLELVDYDSHGSPLWLNVPRPEYPAPPWWTPPQSLITFLRDNLHKRNVTLARYGIDETNCPPELAALNEAEQTTEQHVQQTAEQTDGQPVQRKATSPTPLHSTAPPSGGRPRAGAREGSAGAAPRAARNGDGKQRTACAPAPAAEPEPTREPATCYDEPIDPQVLWLVAGIKPRSNDPEEKARHDEARQAFIRGAPGPVNGYEFPPRDRFLPKGGQAA